MNFCRNCGNGVHERAEVCPKCGIRPLAGYNYCAECGSKTAPRQEICTRCGIRLGYPQPQNNIAYSPSNNNVNTAGNISNYMIPGIILCFVAGLIGGLIVLYFSNKVNQCLRVGDYNGAVAASNNAKIATWIIGGLAVLGWISLLSA